MALAHDPRANQILAALPDAELQRWLPELEPVALSPGEVMRDAGAPSAHVVFPTSAIVSLLYRIDGDASAAIAMVGREGVVGVSLYMGDQCIPGRAVVQCAGEGYRLKGAALEHGFSRAPMLQLVLGFTRALVTQMAQTAVCNREHTLEQRLCRWLLLSLDRLPGNELPTTHALIATMLGAPLAGVSHAVAGLHGRGLIRDTPERITVLDRAGLARHACACYAQVAREYAHLESERAAA